MNATGYQALAMTTANKELNETDKILNAALGLSGESGEVNDIIKKHLYHGHELDREHLIDELGDVCWYIALMCEALDTTMGNVMNKNVRKLQKRYPEGFDSNKSINREENV